MKRRTAILVLLCALAALPATAAESAKDGSWLQNGRDWVRQLWRDDARQWLERIDGAVLNNEYQGVIVFAQGDRIESLAVEHRLRDGVETLRLRTLSGPPRELVKRNGRIQSDSLGADAPASGAASAQTTFSQFGRLARNKWYKAALAEQGRVAGRPAQAIDIRAVDDWRYGYRLWLDQETGLPLKIVTLDERGYTVEQVAFTQIRISPAKGKPAGHRPPAPKVLDNPFKDVKGFRLVARGRKGASEHYLFSDGLASVSLYVEPAAVRDKAQMRKDSVNGLMFADGSTRYVVLGKVPVATLERILAAARP